MIIKTSPTGTECLKTSTPTHLFADTNGFHPTTPPPPVSDPMRRSARVRHLLDGADVPHVLLRLSDLGRSPLSTTAAHAPTGGVRLSHIVSDMEPNESDAPELDAANDWLQNFIAGVDVETKYIECIGPFLYQMLILESVMRSMATMLFALPETPESDPFERAIFGDRATLGRVVTQLELVMTARDRMTAGFEAALTTVSDLIKHRNALAHVLPKIITGDGSEPAVRVAGTSRSLEDLRAASQHAREARHTLQTAYVRATLGPRE